MTHSAPPEQFVDGRQRNRRCRRFLAISAFLVVLVGLSPAHADGYPDSYYPDRGVHTYCFDALSAPNSSVKNRVHYSMDDNDGVEAQTVVSTQFYAACSPPIDVRIRQARAYWFGREVLGLTECERLNSNGFCDQWAVTINWVLISSLAGNDGYGARHTICHEIGHSLGLAHYDNAAADSPDGPAIQSCMRSGLHETGAAAWRTYGPDHRSHVRRWFTS